MSTPSSNHHHLATMYTPSSSTVCAMLYHQKHSHVKRRPLSVRKLVFDVQSLSDYPFCKHSLTIHPLQLKYYGPYPYNPTLRQKSEPSTHETPISCHATTSSPVPTQRRLPLSSCLGPVHPSHHSPHRPGDEPSSAVAWFFDRRQSRPDGSV